MTLTVVFCIRFSNCNWKKNAWNQSYPKMVMWMYVEVIRPHKSFISSISSRFKCAALFLLWPFSFSTISSVIKESIPIFSTCFSDFFWTFFFLALRFPILEQTSVEDSAGVGDDVTELCWDHTLWSSLCAYLQWQNGKIYRIAINTSLLRFNISGSEITRRK